MSNTPYISSMKPKPTALPTDISLEAICWLLACTKQRIDQLVAAGVVTKVARGRYSITSIPRFVETQRKGGTGPQTWQDVRIALAQEKLIAAQRQRYRDERLLIPTAAAIEAFRGVVRVLRDRMLGLPTRMAPRVHSARSVPETQLILEEAVREALETTSKMSNEDILRRIEQLDRQELRRGNKGGEDDHEAA